MRHRALARALKRERRRRYVR